MSMNLTVGPVIGLVTATSARILVEVDQDADVAIYLEADGLQLISNLDCLANRAAVFHFDGLAPKTTWQVTVRGVDHPPSSFRTFGEKVTLEDELTFGIVSCNNYRITEQFVTGASCVWQATANHIKEKKVDCLLHLGDQIYGDDDWSNFEDGKLTRESIIGHCVFAQAVDLLAETDPNDWPSVREKITEMYRNCYREAWGKHGPTRTALANCPSIMMYDDHDIRDDLGDKDPEFDPESNIRFIVDCGRRACFEYQRQLQEDFDLSGEQPVKKVERENHIVHVMGEIGLLFVDSRGAKVFNVTEDDPKPFLTAAQWKDIHSALSPTGAFKDCKLVIVNTQIPVVFFPQSITETIAMKADDFEGMWSYQNNRLEQMELLETMLKWKQGSGDRTICLTGGDVHLAGFTQIYKDGTFAFDQIICGPVSNKTIASMELAVTNFVKEVGEDLGDGWSYQHANFSNERNIGLVKTAPGPQDSVVTCSHLLSKGNEGIQLVPCKRSASGSRPWYEQWQYQWKVAAAVLILAIVYQIWRYSSEPSLPMDVPTLHAMIYELRDQLAESKALVAELKQAALHNLTQG